MVLDNPIRVRIRVENSFNKLQNFTSQLPPLTANLSAQSSTPPFYEIYERKTSQILLGYNLRREKVVLYSISNDKNNPKFSYETIEQKLVEMVYNKESLNKLINIRLDGILKDFIAGFQHNIYKIELDHIKPKKPINSTSQIEFNPDDGYVSCKNSSRRKNSFSINWRKKSQYRTFPKSKFIKAERLLIIGRTNIAFNRPVEFEGGNKSNKSNDQSAKHEIKNPRGRSKSLPDTESLNTDVVLAKSSFSNMSLIIEQDETKKS